MACSVRSVKHPLATITNHGLIKILILDALGSTQMTWRQFLGLPKESEEEQQEEVSRVNNKVRWTQGRQSKQKNHRGN
jgi:hypothetical protein